jgi:hypothetical protein
MPPPATPRAALGARRLPLGTSSKICCLVDMRLLGGLANSRVTTESASPRGALFNCESFVLLLTVRASLLNSPLPQVAVGEPIIYHTE